MRNTNKYLCVYVCTYKNNVARIECTFEQQTKLNDQTGTREFFSSCLCWCVYRVNEGYFMYIDNVCIYVVSRRKYIAREPVVYACVCSPV